MIKIELTKNYNGITLSGSYSDLSCLYESISHFIKEEKTKELDSKVKIMNDYIYSFLYDLRKTYEGKREVLKDDSEVIIYKNNFNMIEVFTLIAITNGYLNIYNTHINSYYHYYMTFVSLFIEGISSFITLKLKKQINETINDYVIMPYTYNENYFRYHELCYINKKTPNLKKRYLSEFYNNVLSNISKTKTQLNNIFSVYLTSYVIDENIEW